MTVKVDDVEHFVGGAATASLDGSTLEVYDPATGEVIAVVASATPSDVDRAVHAAREAFVHSSWANGRPLDRSRALQRLSDAITADTAALAALESLDTGKPMSQAKRDVESASRFFEYYAGLADKLHGESIPFDPNVVDYTVLLPVGVSAHIIPWNFPLQMFCRGVAPALAAGCSVVVKPAAEAPLTSVRLARIAYEAGIPAGVLNVVIGTGTGAGAHLASHPGVDQVTFTGSVATGTKVASAAAANVVPSVLELGGKSPFIVFPDADLEVAADALTRAALVNAGQTCTSASRLLVHCDVEANFLQLMKTRFAAIRVGAGDSDLDMGPLITAAHLAKVERYVTDAVAEGCEVVVGGERLSGPEYGDGNFFAPTILARVAPDLPVAREEIFGPVLATLSFNSEEEAVRIANDTDFGLVAGVWTRDVGVALRMCGALDAGQVTVNTWGAGAVETPFGGVKHSGFGREKSLEGIRSYLRSKNVCVRMS